LEIMSIRSVRSCTLGLVVAAIGFGTPVLALAKDGSDDDGSTTGTTTQTTTGSMTSGGGGGGGKTTLKRAAGTCTGTSTAKLKSKPDDGRLETEFEVDQNRSGVRWRVSLRRNGRVMISGSAVTRSPSGSFSFERRLRNPVGVDRISARAVSAAGEVCTATLRI
jgi:hypothetical protein